MNFSSFGFSVPASGADTEFIGPAPTRKTLTIFCIASAANDTYVAPQKMTGASQGALLTIHSGPIELTEEKHGSLVKAGWHVWPGSGGNGVAWIESLAG